MTPPPDAPALADVIAAGMTWKRGTGSLGLSPRCTNCDERMSCNHPFALFRWFCLPCARAAQGGRDAE